MQKILCLAESLNVGGAEKALVSLLKLMDYSKFDITLMLISKSGAFLSELDELPQLKVKSLVIPSISPIKQLINVLKVKAVYQWLPLSWVGNYLCKDYDVVIAFCEGYLTKWVAASSAQCKKIAWVHTDMVNNDWPVKTGVFKSNDEEKEAYHRFDVVVAVSDIVARGMKDSFSCNGVRTIYNIIDGDIITKSKQAISPTQHRALNLVSVGRLEYVKGYDQLIDALNILVNERGSDISLILVGDGSQRQILQEQVAKHNLQQYVTFVGSVNNPYPYVADADVFVCPSRQEGFNIAILEAMTLGKPIIATRSAGPCDILDEGKYGVISSNNSRELADAIFEMYSNPENISKYSQLSFFRSRHYDAERQLNAIYSILNQ